MRKILDELDEGGEYKRVEKLCRNLVDMAMGKDLAAIREVLDRVDGKPHQSSDMNVSAGGDLADILASVASRGARVSDAGD